MTRLKELLIYSFGSWRCRHAWTLVELPDRMCLRCDQCGMVTEGFKVAGPEALRTLWRAWTAFPC